MISQRPLKRTTPPKTVVNFNALTRSVLIGNVAELSKTHSKMSIKL
jgi:hypothetical protein